MDKAFVGLAILFIFGHMLSFAMEGVKGTVTTTLTENVGVSSTIISVSSTTGFPSASTLVIEEELLSYTGSTATTFTGVTRGEDDTEATTHASGLTVSQGSLGLITAVLDFKAAQSDVPLLGPLITAFNVSGMFIQFVAKMIIWDYSWFDGEVMGIPLRLIQFGFFALSIGLIVRLYVLLRSGGFC